jgi:predicted enzyme related to lactoylglutathione lyase
MSNESPNRLIWAEIPVTDMKRAKAFYETVLDAPLRDDDTGPNPMAWLPYVGDGGAAGHLYPGKPARKGEGVTPHLAVADPLPEVMDRVKAAGGEVVSDVISIPAGSFFYAIDTEGNSLGLFKA